MALTISYLQLGWVTSEMRLVQQSFLCICMSVFPPLLSITFELTGAFQPRLVKNIRFQIFQVLQETGKMQGWVEDRNVWRTSGDESTHNLSAWLSQQPRTRAGCAGFSCTAQNWWQHMVLLAIHMYVEERAHCSQKYWGHRGEMRICYLGDLGKTKGYCCDVVRVGGVIVGGDMGLL